MRPSRSDQSAGLTPGYATSRYERHSGRLPNRPVPSSRSMPCRNRLTRRSPRRTDCLRVNGASSTTEVISEGSRAAAMVAAPPETEWPIRTAGPPR